MLRVGITDVLELSEHISYGKDCQRQLIHVRPDRCVKLARMNHIPVNFHLTKRAKEAIERFTAEVRRIEPEEEPIPLIRWLEEYEEATRARAGGLVDRGPSVSWDHRSKGPADAVQLVGISNRCSTWHPNEPANLKAERSTSSMNDFSSSREVTGAPFAVAIYPSPHELSCAIC